jgi:uncharacterized protein YwbE
MARGGALSKVALGALTMYFFDPVRGKRRRALVRDQAIHGSRLCEMYCGKALRDLNNRINGLAAEAQALFAPDFPTDRVVCERIRSQLGRSVSHPSAIEVEVHDGHVTLRGPILASEVNDLISAAWQVRGVVGIRNELEEHERAGDIPALQGGEKRRGHQPELMQANWSPATRLLGGVLGTALMANCLTRRTPAAVLGGTLGFALFARAANTETTTRLLERVTHPSQPPRRALAETR